MVLVGLPSKFSEQAKFDREKGLHPIRITFETSSNDFDKTLLNYWPENRVPKSFSEEEDLDAEGKYNHELFEAVNLIEIDSSSSSGESSLSSVEIEVSDYEDGPLMDF